MLASCDEVLLRAHEGVEAMLAGLPAVLSEPWVCLLQIWNGN